MSRVPWYKHVSKYLSALIYAFALICSLGGKTEAAFLHSDTPFQEDVAPVGGFCDCYRAQALSATINDRSMIV